MRETIKDLLESMNEEITLDAENKDNIILDYTDRIVITITDADKFPFSIPEEYID